MLCVLVLQIELQQSSCKLQFMFFVLCVWGMRVCAFFVHKDFFLCVCVHALFPWINLKSIKLLFLLHRVFSVCLFRLLSKLVATSNTN